MSTGHVWPFDTVETSNAPQAPWPSKGPSTYLHAGAGTGWPAPLLASQQSEDTFEAPKAPQPSEEPFNGDRQYYAEYGPKGEALLRLSCTTYSQTTIGSFSSMDDAETAAKALNQLKGY